MKTQPARPLRNFYRAPTPSELQCVPARMNAFCMDCNIIDTNLRNYCVGTYGGCKQAWLDYEYKWEPK